jgi:hypothetical protein
VVYICISEHVVLRLYIHVIFVDGLHQKIGETLPNFLAKEHVCSTPIALAFTMIYHFTVLYTDFFR